MKKILKLDKATGKFATPPGEKYGVTAIEADGDVLITPFDENNLKAYDRILLRRMSDASPVWVGDAKYKLYVAVRAGDEMHISSFAKGGFDSA